MNQNLTSAPHPTTCRDFLKTSAALGQLALERSVHAAGNNVIRIGLIGCGGRGTDAAGNALNAGEDIRLVKRSAAVWHQTSTSMTPPPGVPSP